MAVSDDRTGHLPDEILLAIFSLLPIKSIARVAVVCKRWNRLFHRIHLHPIMLDFGEEFSSGRSSNEVAGSVSLSLRLLGGNNLRGFKLIFYPSIPHMSNVNAWSQCLVEKDVEQLELDFCIDYGPLTLDEFTESEKKRFKLPSCLFGCKTITHFKLRRSDFSIPTDFSGFSFLTDLCLFNVNITDELLERMLETCPSLEILCLRECFELSVVKICGENLRLKSLAHLDNMCSAELQIHAPNLRVFHFNGDCFVYNFSNIPSLVDAIVCAVGENAYDFEYNRVYILDKLRHVEILTLCYAAIWDMALEEVIEPELLPITFHNLHELQILLRGIHEYELGLSSFLEHCTFPALEKLFIELDVEHENRAMGHDPDVLNLPDQLFYNLRKVKINSYRGYPNEILLVKFLLEKAIVLELLLLVAPAPEINKNDSPETPMSSVLEQLSLFPKVSSEAQILFYEYEEDDKKLVPTHARSMYYPLSYA